MTFSDFIDRLKEAGWKDTCDAQHDNIFGLWKELLIAKTEPVAEVPCSVGLSAELAEVKEKYYELLMAVQSKFPDETRHETALRYIRNAEIGSNEASEATSI